MPLGIQIDLILSSTRILKNPWPHLVCNSNGRTNSRDCRPVGWTLETSAARCVWTWCPWRPGRRTPWWRTSWVSTTWRASGPPADSATFTAVMWVDKARALLSKLLFQCSRLHICNRSISTVGSGLGLEPGSPPLTRQQQGGERTPGPTPATSPSSSLTTWPSPTTLSISSRGPGSPWRPALPSWTPGTTTVSSGTTAPATGPRCGSVR